MAARASAARGWSTSRSKVLSDWTINGPSVTRSPNVQAATVHYPKSVVVAPVLGGYQPGLHPGVDSRGPGNHDPCGMTFTDYLLDSILVLLVVRQIRETRLDR